MKHTGIVILLGILAVLCTGRVAAQNRGFGMGVMIGEPTGISFKGWLNHTNAIDGGLAWSFAPKGSSVHLHADYLWHSYNVFKTREELLLYYGLGVRFKGAADGDARFGVRVPIGLDFVIRTAPVDVFLEFAPIVDLAPSTELSGNAGLGVRYFFD